MTQIEKMMKNLGLTEQEARELLADDAKVDKGQKMAFDLTPEQEKNAKKARATGTKKPTAYKFENRKRKENPEKRDIMKAIHELAVDCWDGAELVNPERQVDFHLNGSHYSITLICHRAPKE
jgi:hypothetical protein